MTVVEKGMKFGRLTTIELTGEKSNNNGPIWLCKCDCGENKEVPQSYLKHGTTKSCGCLNKGRAFDLTGKKFNMLTAIRRVGTLPTGGAVWECQCDCGNEELVCVSSSNLINGKTKSCGCLPVGKAVKDLQGDKFGKLTAIRKTDQRVGSNVVWECKCDCGNITFVSSGALQSGATKSCGCLNRKNIAGQKFGKLTALAPTEERYHRHVVWECQCECGNTTFATVNDLRNNRKKSCGCLKQKMTMDLVGEKSKKEILRADRELIKETKQQEILITSQIWDEENHFEEPISKKEFIDKPEAPPKVRHINRSEVPVRDPKKSWMALCHAEHKCEIDKAHPTFTSKTKNVDYTEPHHLVPMEYSGDSRFACVSLDVPANIVSLCSNCHNQLHYGKDIEKQLRNLYDARMERLEKAGIVITFEELLSLY